MKRKEKPFSLKVKGEKAFPVIQEKNIWREK